MTIEKEWVSFFLPVGSFDQMVVVFLIDDLGIESERNEKRTHLLLFLCCFLRDGGGGDEEEVFDEMHQKNPWCLLSYCLLSLLGFGRESCLLGPFSLS